MYNLSAQDVYSKTDCVVLIKLGNSKWATYLHLTSYLLCPLNWIR